MATAVLGMTAGSASVPAGAPGSVQVTGLDTPGTEFQAFAFGTSGTPGTANQYEITTGQVTPTSFWIFLDRPSGGPLTVYWLHVGY